MTINAKQDPLFETISGLPTGFIELDRMTSGFQPGDLIIVAARTGMGKTSFVLNIAMHVALMLRQTVAIFSMAQEGQQLAMRMLGTDSGIAEQVLHCGRLEGNDWAKLASSLGKLNEAPILIDDTSGLDVIEICSRSKQFFQEKAGLGLIVIDYLGLMNGIGYEAGESRPLGHAEITQPLNQLAKELNVPIILLASLNRNCEKRLDRRPLLSDLGVIEQVADVVLFIHREECYSTNPLDKGKAEVIVAKNKNGNTGIVRLVFLKELGRFKNIAATDLSAGLCEDTFTNMSQLIVDSVGRFRLRKACPNTITGISTCFPSLDNYTSGLQRGDLIVVAARPSMGERSFVLNIAMHVALINKLPVAIMENETGSDLLVNRLIASNAKLSWHDLRTGQIRDDNMERFECAIDVLKDAPIYFSSITPLSIQELGEQLRMLNKRTSGLELVVVDCLQELKLSDDQMNRESALKNAQTSRYLKALAKELNVPIVVFSPVERDIEERSNKRPVLADLSGKAAIANAADLVLIVYRDEVYDTESEDIGTAEIIIRKNLQGAVGSVRLKFDGRLGNFEEINHGL